MRNNKYFASSVSGRIMAFVLSCVMPFTVCPVTVSAADENTQVSGGYVYGKVNLSYADYYYGELNNVSESAVMDLAAGDKAAVLRDYGMYDEVSSATTSKYKNFASTYYSDNEESGTGGIIGGIKDTNIAVPKELYNEAKAAVDGGMECSNKLLEIISNITVTEEVPSEYKVLNGDGTLTEMRDFEKAINVDDAQISMANSTTWGQYQISVVSDKLPERDDMEAVVIETADGTKYGMKHLENLWFRTGEIAFAVTDGFKVPQGNTLTSKRYMDLPGKTISKITYIVRGGADVVFNTNLFCKTLIDKNDGYNYSGENTIYKDGAKIVMNGVTPKDSNYVLSKVAFGEKELEKNVDYTYQDDVLTIKANDNTGIGKYRLTYSDSKYEDISTYVQFTSAMTADEIKIDDGGIKISNKEVTIKEYLSAIDSIKVNGSGLRGNNLGSVVFDEYGNINFDAEISFHGNKSKVFPEAGKEYTLEITSAGYPSVSGTVKSPEAAYQYVYAGLTWAEFWEGENVYVAYSSGISDSSDEADSREEYDKGAFDAVSRATVNHGLHRGSYQCDAIIYDTDGKTYQVSHWNSGTEAVLKDGGVIKFDKGAITYTDTEGIEHSAAMEHYEVSGIKYVPVAVKTEDFEEFVSKYPVTKNGETVSGGYSENNLTAYSKTSEINADTNGLKTAVKNQDGSFSFSKRMTGTGSGIAGESQKKAENIVVTVKEADGSYGEFLRVDLTGDGYGDLGSNMYAVRWTYYGQDSSYNEALVSYGTKFAADNWMHKANGIQLGLTDSLRCNLPNVTDGTGYWELTVYAMGYEDYTVRFSAADENVIKPQLISIEDMKISLGSTVYYYDGKSKKPAVTVGNLIKDIDYTVSYKNNKNIGKASVEIEGIGKYTGKVTKSFTITVKKGAVYKSGSLKYSITKASLTGTGIVAVYAPVSKSIKTVSIPAEIKIGGKSFKVTSIGESAFKNCKKLSTVSIGSNVTAIGTNAFSGDSALKKITIKSVKLTKVGKNSFKGINKNAVIKVPASKLKSYSKLLKGKGQGSKVKITK